MKYESWDCDDVSFGLFPSSLFLCVTGKCLSRFTNSKTPYCIRFNPDPEKSHLFVVGCADKKIYTVSLSYTVPLTVSTPALQHVPLSYQNYSSELACCCSLNNCLNVCQK